MENQPSMDDQFLRKIHQCIDENLSNEKFSVDDLAKHAGLSRSMLHRKLIKLTGKSATDLITEKRLLKAKELLENNTATASEIAYQVGFNSPSYFTKVFKNYFHVSPGDVRKGVSMPLPRENRFVTKGKIKRFGLILLLGFITFTLAGAGFYFFFLNNKPVEKSIAILPFDNLSSNNENQYFADGIVEDLLNRLSKIEGLKVISRTSSEMFRDKGSKTIPQIGDLLKVSYILEGTVQRDVNNVRINIQLIDAKKDNHILSQQYDRNLSEVFKIQSEIAEQIVRELSHVLTDQQEKRLKQDQTKNLKAFEYKQLGRYYLNRRTKEDLLESVKYIKMAITEDPNYALAYAELADAFFIQSWYEYINRQTARDSAVYMALKALELDNSLGEANTVLGAIYNEYDREYKPAEKEFKKAIETNPNHATAYQYYSEFLCEAGKLEEARELINKAVQLDPYSYIIRFASSFLYYKEEKFIQALAENQLCQELGNEHVSAVSLEYKIYLKLQNETAALASYKKLGKLLGEWTPEQADSVYRVGGFNGLFWWQLQDGKWKHESDKAKYYAMLGEDEKALDMLELAMDENLLLPLSLSSLEYKNLLSHPRFIAIRKKMGLPPL